jgi:hypothetical protein
MSFLSHIKACDYSREVQTKELGTNGDGFPNTLFEVLARKQKFFSQNDHHQVCDKVKL